MENSGHHAQPPARTPPARNLSVRLCDGPTFDCPADAPESPSAPNPLRMRRRSRTQIFKEVMSSVRARQLSVQLSDGDAAEAVVAIAACVAARSAVSGICAPTLTRLLECDSRSHKLVSHHEVMARRGQPCKAQVEEFLSRKNRVLFSDVVQALLAAISGALYVYETYAVGNQAPGVGRCEFSEVERENSTLWPVPLYVCTHGDSFSRDEPIRWISIVEACFAVVYATDYCLRFYVAPHRLRYVFSLFPMADLISILPVILFWTGVVDPGTSFGFVRVVRLLRLLRVLKAYRVVTGSQGEWTALKQANVLFFTVFSLVFIAAGLIHWAERDQGITFGDSVYFIVVTMATVGYGDVAPKSAFGKVVMVLLILAAIVLIPVQTRGLVDLLAEKPKEMFKDLPGGEQGFVVLAGHHLTYDDVYMFVKEFYHPAHSVAAGGNWDYGEAHYNMPPGIVIVSLEPLGVKLRNLLRLQAYKRRMRYVVGSLLEEDTLRKICAPEAKACFVFATGKELKTSAFTEASRDKEGLDMVTSLQTLNFRSYTRYQVETYCLLNHSAGRSTANAASADYIMSLDETRLKLMAQSCICPGLSTLVINFATSYREVSKKDRDDLRRTCAEEDEYRRGMSHVVYEMQVPKQLVGASFIEASVCVYMKFQIATLGVINKLGSTADPAAPAAAPTPSQNLRRRGTLRGVRDLGRAGHTSKEQATAAKVGGMFHKLPEFNFILNPGHRYRLCEGDVLAVISVDLATCEVCQEHADFPLRDTSRAADLHSQAKTKASPQAAAAVHGRVGSGYGSLRSRRARRRLKGFIWAIISLLKLRPVQVSLERRTVLDVNAACVKHRDYVAAREAGLPGDGTEFAFGEPFAHTDGTDETMEEGDLDLFGATVPAGAGNDGGGGGGGGGGGMSAAPRTPRLGTELKKIRRGLSALCGGKRLRNVHSHVTDWQKEGLFEGHIIITGGQRNLAQFIRALKRSLCATQTPLKTVLYLAKEPPAGEVWNRVSHYRYFYYCQGDPKLSNDLYRAGLEDASSLVILSPDHEVVDGETDAEAVFIAMAAINLCPLETELVQTRAEEPFSPGLQKKLAEGLLRNSSGAPILKRGNGKPLFMIAELASSLSVKYFEDFDVLQAARCFGLNAKETMELRVKTLSRASGRASPPGVNLGCLPIPEEKGVEAFTSTHQLSTYYSAGFLLSNQMLGPILPHTYYSPSLIRVVDQFMQGSLNQYGSFLGSVPVPLSFVDKTYGELYYHMAINLDMVPLGLYRAPSVHSKVPLAYVVTNPPKASVVRKHDMVYVLQSGVDELVDDEESECGSNAGAPNEGESDVNMDGIRVESSEASSPLGGSSEWTKREVAAFSATEPASPPVSCLPASSVSVQIPAAHGLME